MGRLAALNVGTWADTGAKPVMTPGTADALVDWCYAGLTYVGLKGRRVVVFGHHSMGLETALAHILPTRQTFSPKNTRFDTKLLPIPRTSKRPGFTLKQCWAFSLPAMRRGNLRLGAASSGAAAIAGRRFSTLLGASPLATVAPTS